MSPSRDTEVDVSNLRMSVFIISSRLISRRSESLQEKRDS